jgi:hypothetical protein
MKNRIFKRTIILLALLFLQSAIYAQVESAQIGAEFKEVSANAGRQIQGIQTYNSGEVKGSQFFFPTWTGGSVTTINNEVISNNYSFLYDKVRQQLFMKWKDSSIVLQAEKDQITGFTLNTDKVHSFVSAAVYIPTDNTNFFEVLDSSRKGYSLLKLVRATFVKADPTDMLRMREGDVYDKFVDDISYYISYNNGLPRKIAFKEKSIQKAFPSVSEKIAEYYNQKENKNMDDNFLIGLIQALNN